MTEQTAPNTRALVETQVLDDIVAVHEAIAQPGAHEAFDQMLVVQTEQVPEIADRQLELSVAGKELIDEFGIEPAFFEDRSRAMLFTSLASRHSRNLDSKEESSWESNVAEKTFIADTVFLLAKDYSSVLGDAKELHARQKQEDAPILSEKGLKELLDKFSDPKLSEEVKAEAIKDGVFDEVSQRLGLEEHVSTTDVEIRVLGIGPEYADSAFDVDATHLTQQEAQEWAAGLKKRADRFAAGFSEGELAASAAGFVVRLEGTEYIYIPQARAEAYLAEKHGVPLNEDGKKRATKTKGLLQHEFTHTKEDVKVGPDLGSSLEERRAEHFSGDTSEYFDVKQFFNQLAVLRGVHVVKLFDEQAEARRQGGAVDIYEMLAAAYGIDETIEIATIQPHPYRMIEKSEFVKSASNYLGSYEGVIGRMAQKLTADQKATVKERVEKKKKIMLDQPEQSQFLIDYVGDYYAPIENNL